MVAAWPRIAGGKLLAVVVRAGRAADSSIIGLASWGALSPALVWLFKACGIVAGVP
jgi:hypothetical protein